MDVETSVVSFDNLHRDGYWFSPLIYCIAYCLPFKELKVVAVAAAATNLFYINDVSPGSSTSTNGKNYILQ